MLIVGIDVGASFHVAAVMREDDDPKEWRKLPVIRVELNRNGFNALKQMVESRRHSGEPVSVALEPTGRFYAETIAGFCQAQGWRVCWVENKTLHDYRTMMKAPSKNDDVDARLLAHYLRCSHDTIVEPDTTSKHLRYLVQELGVLNKQRTQYINRTRQVLKAVWPELPFTDSKWIISLLLQTPSAHALRAIDPNQLQQVSDKKRELLRALASDSIGIIEPLYESRVRYFATTLRQLDERISLIMADIDRLVMEHPDAEILLSVPGIGVKTVAALIGTYGDISRYKDRRTFARRLGVAPNITQSGTSVHSTTINRRSSKYARTALHFAAISLLSPNAGQSYFKQYFEERRNDKARGHNRKLFGRLRGKIAEVLFTLLSTRQLYDASRHSGICLQAVS